MKKFGIQNLCTFTLSLLMICSLFLHSSFALTLPAQASTVSAQALTSPAQSQSKPMQTQGKKRAYSELKGLWISDDIFSSEDILHRRELIQFADDKQKSFAVSTSSGSVTMYHTTVKSSLESFRQTSDTSYELVYRMSYRTEIEEGKVTTSDELKKCSIRWIDDNTIEVWNYPFLESYSVDEEGNVMVPASYRRYTRIAKARLSSREMALKPINAHYIPEGWTGSATYEPDEAKRAKHLNYLEPTDKKILEAIEKDYKEIYKNKGKYKNIRLEVLIALEAVAG